MANMSQVFLKCNFSPFTEYFYAHDGITIASQEETVIAYLHRSIRRNFKICIQVD